MTRFCYKLFIRGNGERNGLHLPTGFSERCGIKPNDFFIPCLWAPRHKMKTEDPIFGYKEMILRFRRDVTGKLYETFDELDAEDFDR